MIALIRHGETALNASHVLQPEDTPLSEVGRAQALALAQRFHTDAALSKPDAIVTSPLPRTRDTALALRTQYPDAQWHEHPLLQERNFGDYRGQPYSVLGESVLSYRGKPPNGESADEFEARVAQAFADIKALAATCTTLVVVTHGLMIRALLDKHVQLVEPMVRPNAIANTSITLFDKKAPHRVTLLACDQHLRT